jgi:hypothetical protein
MSENATSKAVQNRDWQNMESIAAKYLLMESALQHVDAHGAEDTYSIRLVMDALSFDPLSHASDEE